MGTTWETRPKAPRQPKAPKLATPREQSGGSYSSAGPKIKANRPLGQNTMDQSGFPKPTAIRSVHEKLNADPSKTGTAWGLKPEYKRRDDGPGTAGVPARI